MAEETVELMFFDTFSHSTSDESGNMDLVQFPQPVEVCEVRVIPLGCRVQADFPGGHPRLGATNPSEFQLEFFVNDLSRRNSCTFIQLGELDFSRDEIKFNPKRVPTDGLLIKGRYNTITLAVYGIQTKLEGEFTPPEPQPQQQKTEPQAHHSAVELSMEWKSDDAANLPGDSRQHFKDIAVRSPKEEKRELPCSFKEDIQSRDPPELEERYTPPGIKKRKRPQTPPLPRELSRRTPSPPLSRTQKDDPSKQERPDSRSRRDRERDEHGYRRRSGSLEHEIEKAKEKEYNAYLERQRESERKFHPSTSGTKKESHGKWSDSSPSEEDISDDLEEISSDDEPFDPVAMHLDDSPTKSSSEATNDVQDFVFDVAQQLVEEITSAAFLREKGYLPPGLNPEKVSDFVQRSENEGEALKGQKFVTTMEDTVSLFGPNSRFETLASDIQFALVDWCRDGLDFELALKQSQPAFKVRHLKAGLKLTMAVMSSCGEDTMTELLRNNTAGGHFLELYLKSYMSVPLKLQLIRCLDMLTHFQCGLEYLLYESFPLTFPGSSKAKYTTYQAIIKFLLSKPSTRVSMALSSVLSKLHLCDLCATLKNVAVDLMNSDPGMEPSLDEATIILKQIFETHLEAGASMGQYVRSVPIGFMWFEPPKPTCDPYVSLYAMYKYNDFLVTCTVLASRSKAFRTAFDAFLEEIMGSIHGCLYLLENPAMMPLLEKMFPKVSPTLRSIALISTIFENTSKDALEEFQDRLDENEILVQALHRLVCFTLERSNPRCIEGLVRALSLEDNLECLLQFLQRKDGQPLIKSNVCESYAIVLIKTVLQYGNLPNSFFERYLTSLLEISETCSRLESLSAWLEPVAKLEYPLTTKSLGPLVASMKSYIDDNALLCPQIITAIQTLRYICAPVDVLRDEQPTTRHRYNLAEVYSHDGLSVLCQLVEKLCDYYAAPLAVKLELSSEMKKFRLMQVMRPAIEMISLILKMVIHRQAAEFQDLTPIPMALSAFQLFWAVGENRLCYVIVTILLAYTQPKQDGTESEQTLSKSLWTLMFKQVLGNIQSGPKAFGVTLRILCELLPLPLPMKIDRPFEREEDAKLLDINRKLWSVHLDLCRPELAELYLVVSASTDVNIVRMLEALTVQICDLSAPSCKMMLEILSQTIVKFPKTGIDQRFVQGILNIVAHLCDNHLPSAVGVLLLYSSLTSFCNPLKSAVNLLRDTQSDKVALSCVRLIESVLMKATKYVKKQIAADLIKAMLNHAASKISQPTAILEVLRCLVTIKSESPAYITEVIEDKVSILYGVTSQLASKFSIESQDSVSALLSLVELIKRLDEKAVRELVTHEDGQGQHPLVQLKLKLQDGCLDEYEDTLQLLQTFIDINPCPDTTEVEVDSQNSEIPLPVEPLAPKSLAEVFEAERLIYIVVDDEEADNISLPHLMLDLDEYEHECMVLNDTLLVETDLVSISETCTISELSLRAELEKLLSKTIKQEPLLSLPKSHRSQSLSEEVKKPFVAPMRPSVAPVMSSRQNRANDPFRSRPPNTSRPPSMHVDDFVAMESSSSRGMHRPERSRQQQQQQQQQQRGSRGSWQSGQRYF